MLLGGTVEKPNRRWAVVLFGAMGRSNAVQMLVQKFFSLDENVPTLHLFFTRFCLRCSVEGVMGMGLIFP
jgi:hypothetical protein